MKHIFFFLIFSLIAILSFGQGSYNARSIYFAGSSGTDIKDTTSYCATYPCPNGTMILGSGLQIFIKKPFGWKLIGPSPAGVTSFNDRTGAVLPLSGDYTFDKISGVLNGEGTTVVTGGGNRAINLGGNVTSERQLLVTAQNTSLFTMFNNSLSKYSFRAYGAGQFAIGDGAFTPTTETFHVFGNSKSVTVDNASTINLAATTTNAIGTTSVTTTYDESTGSANTQAGDYQLYVDASTSAIGNGAGSQIAISDAGGTSTYSLNVAGSMQINSISQSTGTLNLLGIVGEAGLTHLSNGDLWYNSATNKFRARQNGVSVDMITAATTPAGATTLLQYNNAGAFGATGSGNKTLAWSSGTGSTLFTNNTGVNATSFVTSSFAGEFQIDNGISPTIDRLRLTPTLIDKSVGTNDLVISNSAATTKAVKLTAASGATFKVYNNGADLTVTPCNATYTANGVSGFIPLALTATATLDFPSTAAGAFQELTVSLSGASLSDPVMLGIPNSSMPASLGIYTYWVSSSNTVTVRFSNVQTVGNIDPASGSFIVTIMKIATCP